MVRKSVEEGTVHLHIMPHSALKLAVLAVLEQACVLLSACARFISSDSGYQEQA